MNESLIALAKVMVGAQVTMDSRPGPGTIVAVTWNEEGQPYWVIEFGPDFRVVVLVSVAAQSLLEDYEKSMEK